MSFSAKHSLKEFRYESVRQYIAQLYLQHMAHSTVCSHISALKFYCKQHSINNDLELPQVGLILRGVRNSRLAAQKVQRKTCTLANLERLVALARVHYGRYEASLVRCMFSLAFFGFLRVSEYAMTPAGHAIRLDGCKVLDGALEVSIPSSKTNRSNVVIKLEKYSVPKSVCPVSAFQAYCRRRQKLHEPHLFVGTDLKPLRASDVAKYLSVLTNLAGLEGLRTHSFRSGGASWAARQGWSDAAIRTHGRWHSSAFLDYVRPV